MTHKLIPTALLLLTACGGVAVAPNAQLPELDAGSPEDAASSDAGSSAEEDAGIASIDSGTEPGLDAGTVSPPPVDAGQPEVDAGASSSGLDAGPSCDSALGDYWLVTGSTCGRQTRVACVLRWDECGMIGQRGCQLDGSAATSGVGYCIEGGRPFGSNGYCSPCR